MLELLVKKAPKGSEPGFSSKNVRWAISFDSQSGFTGVVELGAAGKKSNPGLPFLKCPDLTQPELISGSSPRSQFLIETASVVAEYKVESAETKTRAKHEFFVSMLKEAGKSIPQLETISKFMQDADILQKIREEMQQKGVGSSDKVTFQLDGEFPVGEAYCHEWWRHYYRNVIRAAPTQERSAQYRSFATGELVIPARTHPKIRGLAAVGGLASGDVLIGCDKEAFWSYGLEQSFNAAVSEEEARAYADVLNELVRSGKNLAGVKVVYWFKEKVKREDDPLTFLVEPEDVLEANARTRARKLLLSIEKGERPDLVGNWYYIMIISGAAGRIMVRNWLEGEFTEFVKNVNQWFDDLEMVVLDDGVTIAPPPRFTSLLKALVRDLDELPAPLEGKLFCAAVRNEEIPYQIVAQSLNRRKVEILKNEKPSVDGMALLRAYHLRKYRKEGNELAQMLTPKLNEDFPDVAYQCGRLMAALANLQQAALGRDVGAGVVQRYYAAASTTPALVLGRLIRNSQHHLNKLEARLAYWYEGKIAEICSQITEPLPTTFALEEQSLFALGYYHQLANFRAGKLEDKEERKED